MPLFLNYIGEKIKFEEGTCLLTAEAIGDALQTTNDSGISKIVVDSTGTTIRVEDTLPGRDFNTNIKLIRGNPTVELGRSSDQISLISRINLTPGDKVEINYRGTITTASMPKARVRLFRG